MESVADWSGLSAELLEQIAIRLLIKEDFTALRGVCTSWRAAVTQDMYLNGSKLPMLLLPEKNFSSERQVYSLSERRICGKVALPQEMSQKCLLDVGFGWVLTKSSYPVDEDGHGDLHLFQPLSRAKPIQLPKWLVIPFTITRAVLSDDPSSNINAVLMVTTDRYFFSFRIMKNDGFSDRPYSKPSSCCCYDETVYALETAGKIWSWEASGINVKLLMKVDENVLSEKSNYLVNSTANNGSLLLISRNDKSRSFSVVRIDVARREWEVTTDLRGDAIFLSDNLAVAVAAADYPGVLKPNCIYFANDFVENTDSLRKVMGVYNVQDRSLEEFDFEYSLSSPPLWISRPSV